MTEGKGRNVLSEEAASDRRVQYDIQKYCIRKRSGLGIRAEDIYNEIGFTAEYKEGDRENEEFYRRKYARLLKEGLIVYRKDGESSIMERRYDLKELVTNSPDMYFFDMDKDGKTETRIEHAALMHPQRYIVSIPGYMERLQNGQVPESMKRKLYYDGQNYFVRVTKEQYKDLIQGLHDARKQAEEHTVPLSYFIEDIENEEYQSKYNLNYKHKHQ